MTSESELAILISGISQSNFDFQLETVLQKNPKENELGCLRAIFIYREINDF